jgi:hypothetical protein
VIALAEDREGNIWFGTLADGARRLARHGFSAYTEADGLASATIRGSMRPFQFQTARASGGSRAAPDSTGSPKWRTCGTSGAFGPRRFTRPGTDWPVTMCSRCSRIVEGICGLVDGCRPPRSLHDGSVPPEPFTDTQTWTVFHRSAGRQHLPKTTRVTFGLDSRTEALRATATAASCCSHTRTGRQRLVSAPSTLITTIGFGSDPLALG